MKGVKILHIADLHLGSKFDYLNSQKAIQRQTECMLSLNNCIKQFSDAQIVLIAGDIFDCDVSDSTIDFVLKVFENYQNIKFFVCFGNHDHLGHECSQKLIEQTPPNVYIFGSSVSCVDLDDLNVSVYGASFSGSHLYSSLFNDFCVKDASRINIMLMHGEVGDYSQYNPISKTDIKNSGLDYLALGHIHSFSGFNLLGKTQYAYPGILEPTGFDECEQSGAIYGQIGKDSFDLKLYSNSKRKYIIHDFDISHCTNDAQIISELNMVLNQENLYKINLVGKKGAMYIANVKNISENLNVFYNEITDLSSSAIDFEEYANDPSLAGAIAKNIIDIKNNGSHDEQIVKLAENILVDMLFGGEN